MAYSLDQARILLQSTELTPQALLNLVKQISVEASGSVTILYGGNLPDEQHWGQTTIILTPPRSRRGWTTGSYPLYTLILLAKTGI